MIGDSVTAPFEVDAVALPTDVRSVQVTDDFVCHCSTGGEGVPQEYEGRGRIEAGSAPGG